MTIFHACLNYLLTASTSVFSADCADSPEYKHNVALAIAANAEAANQPERS